MSKKFGRFVLVICLSIVVAACGAGPESTGSTVPAETTTTISNLGGDRLPVQIPGEEYGHFAASLTGTLHLQSNGCWTVDLGDGDRLVVFPPDYTLASDGAAMMGPGGVSFSDGMAVDAIGGIVPTEGFPGVPDGFWGNYFEFCDPAAAEAVVVDELTPAFDVAALPADELVTMLQEADLSMSWGCGLGFTLSTPDQRVALYLSPNDYEAVPNSPVSFPDDAWQASVAVGKNLMANHCDDVLEGWEPEAVFAAEWPVISGTLEFEPPESASCGAIGPVEANLSGIVVETPEGPVDLGDLTVVNEAYGCFAG
ncbi:MAG: hypothetical protein WD274_07200 [Acidimicrobiia bacterium]